MTCDKTLKRLIESFISIDKDIRIMEVCGTHTRAISKSGIRYMLPENVHLISGPGCPVCVTPEPYIDTAIELLDSKGINIITFGDMLKVKGSNRSLSDMQRARVKVVYSPEDALNIACENSEFYVFLAIGFETTAPLIALTAKLVKERQITNLFFLTALKRMEPVIRYILQDKRNSIDAMICPGHVASVTGADYFKFITQEFHIPSAICGFENEDIAVGICILIEQITRQKPVEFVNMYRRCVTNEGNKVAQNIINQVFEITDGNWRGIGTIENSEFILNEEYSHVDAIKKFGLKINTYSASNCQCSEILIGLKSPNQCKLFGSICTPEHPAGACMVAQEGACAVYYRYKEVGSHG